MSTTIDERVVSMQFDNRQFEANVKTSLGTLDRLKQSLNFNSAYTGLDNVNNAVKNINMNPLSNGVESVRAKFAALDVMAVTALANITNSAVNAGKKIVSALTIDPIKSGFAEYETKINAIQTIMSNTASKGTTMADVTKVIDELNTYADMTIYNFAEMTKNIGTFTAAGVGLEDSAAAIQGIANLAAASGADSHKASTAMYQLSQALAAGTVKLMDWNSVVNAGMGGEKFQNALKETAREMGIAVDDIIKKNGSFRESLSEGWISADVLNTTLKKFTKEGAAEYADAMVKSGKYTEEQAEALKKEAEAMTDAATKVKTFTQLWDTLKESVQSGWGKSWELIVGNFEQARETLTQISDILTGPDSFLTKSADSRNAFLETTLGSNWDELIGRLGKAGVEADKFEDSLRRTLDENNYDTDKLIDECGSLAKVFTSGKVEADILEKAIENLSRKTVDLSKVNRTLWWGHIGEDVKQVQEALVALKYDIGSKGIDGIMGTETQDAIRQFQKDKGLYSDGIVGEKTIAALREAAALTNEIDENSKILAKDYKDLIDVIQQPAGRELLLGSLKNVLEAIMKILNTIGDAWGNVFKLDSSQVYDFIDSINKFTKKLILTDETADNVRRTLSGIFSVLNIIATVIGSGIKIAFTTLSRILGNFNIGFLDTTASIGDALVKMKDTIDGSIGEITDFIVDGVENWISEFKETKIFKECSKYFEDASDAISNAIDKIVKAIEDFDASDFMAGLESIGSFLSNIAADIANSEIFIAIVDGICAAFAKLKSFITGFKLPEFNIDNMTQFTKAITSIEEYGKIGLSGAISALVDYFKGLQSFKWTTFKETALEKLTKFWLTTGDKIKEAFEKGKEIAKSITKFLLGTEEIDLPAILDVANKFLGMITLMKAIEALSNITAPFKSVTDSIENLTASLKWDAMASAFKSLALALGILTVCIIVISQIPAKDALASAGILAGLLVVMGGIVIALGAVSSKMDGWSTAGAVSSLLMMVVSLMLLVETIRQIDNLELKDPAKTFGTLFLTLLALSSGVKMVAKAGGSTFRSVAAILTLMAALKLVLEVIEDYDQFDWSGKSGAIRKMVTMMYTLAGAISIASMGVKAGASSQGLALLLVSMVLSLKLIASAIEDFAAIPEEDLIKGGATVATLLGIMSAMAFALGKAGGGTVLEKGQKSINHFTGLAMALLAVVGAIWLLGKMDISTLKQGGIAVAGILSAFTVMLGVVGNSFANVKKGSIISMLIFVALIMAELAVIIHYMKDVPLEQSIGYAVSLSAVLLAMSFALRSLTKYDISSGNIYKWVGAMALLGSIMAGLAFVLYSVKDMSPASAIGSATAIGILLSAMALAMLTLTKYEVSSGNMYKWVGAMALLGVVIGALAFVLYSVKQMDPLGAIGNVAAIGILLGAMTGVLAVLNARIPNGTNIAKWVGALAGLTSIVYGLTGVLQNLKGLDVHTSIGNVAALVILLGAITGVVALLSVLKVDYKIAGGVLTLVAIMTSMFILVEVLKSMQGIENARENAITLALLAGALSLCILPLAIAGTLASGAAIGVVAIAAVMAALLIVVEVLSRMDGVGNARENAIALALLTSVLSLCMIPLAIAGTMTYGALIGAVAVAAVMAALLIVVEVLSRMDGIGNARENAITLALLTSVLSLCLIPLSIVGMTAYGALIGAVAVAAVMAALLIVVEVLNRMDGIGNARENAITLALLASVLSLCMVPLGIIGALGPAAIIGAASLAVLMSSLFIVVEVLAKMENLSNAKDSADILIEILTALTTSLTIISLLAPLTVVGVGAVSVLVALITKLAAVVTAVGALMDICPAIEDFIDSGLELFKTFAGGLGEIVSAFAVGATSGLEDVGTNLSKFMENAKYFIDNVGSIDSSVIAGAGFLAGAVIALLATDFISAISSMAGMSLADLGTDLTKFAENIGGFITAMSDIDSEAANGVNALVSAIDALTAANLKDVITQILPGDGDNSLADFGTNIEAFASAIQNASIYLANITDDDVANIKRAAIAGEAIAELNKNIPRTGGLWQDIAGEADMADWGAKIEAFAECLVSYSATVSGGAIDVTAIENSAAAATAVADLNSKIPKAGGIWQQIAGEADLANWGNSIVAFGSALVEYSGIVSSGTIDAAAIQTSANAATRLASLNNAIPKAGGVWQDIMGGQDMAAWGDSIKKFGSGLASFCRNIAGLGEDDVTSITNSGDAVSALVEVMKLVPTDGGIKELLFGSKDGMSFGTALVSMAQGIKDYCATAATINEADLTAITNSGTAITTLGEVLALIPETSKSQNASYLAGAVVNLKTVVDRLDEIGESGYSSTGMIAVKNAVTALNTMFTGLDTSTFQSKAVDIYNAAFYIADASTFLNKISGHDFGGVDDFKTAIADLAEIDLDSVITAFSDKATNMQVSVNTLIGAMSTALSSGATTIDTAMSNLVEVALKAVDNKKDSFTTSGEGLVSSLVTGLGDESGSVSSAGNDLGSSANSGIREKYSLVNGAGAYLVLGLVRGLNAGRDSVRNAAVGLANAIEEGITLTLIIQSPSRLAEQWGVYTGEGFVNGLNAYTGRAYDAGADLGTGAATGLSDTISKISDAVSADMDMSPTIRPVVDLSDVKTGANAISSMFSDTNVLGANPHLGAITTMMNGARHTSNDDVISAIRDLGSNLSGMGNTYTINGITYDDGSAVADAIRTITRAAKLERRV